VLTQSSAGMRTGLITGGPSTAARFAGRGLTAEGHLAEAVFGLSQFRRLTPLQETFPNGFAEMLSQIREIAAFLRNSARMTASFTGSEAARERVRQHLGHWLPEMPSKPLADAPTGFQQFDGPARFGLAAPSQVAHCVQVIPALHASHPKAPLVTLAMQMLRVDYMVSELRFKGNAYGANCSYSGRNICLSTYADPHIKRTLDVFVALPDYVRRADWTETELHRGIISTAKLALQPIRPGPATSIALERFLAGETRERRTERYTQLLAATPATVKHILLEQLDAHQDTAPVCVLSNRSKLEAANLKMAGAELQITDIVTDES